MLAEIWRNLPGLRPWPDRLAFAVQKGDVDGLERALSHGADPNHEILDGTTMLMEAAADGRETVVRALLGAHAELNRVSRYGNTALDLADGSHHESIARLLLEHGAKPARELHNVRSHVGPTVRRHAESLAGEAYPGAVMDAPLDSRGAKVDTTAMPPPAKSNADAEAPRHTPAAPAGKNLEYADRRDHASRDRRDRATRDQIDELREEIGDHKKREYELEVGQDRFRALAIRRAGQLEREIARRKYLERVLSQVKTTLDIANREIAGYPASVSAGLETLAAGETGDARRPRGNENVTALPHPAAGRPVSDDAAEPEKHVDAA